MDTCFYFNYFSYVRYSNVAARMLRHSLKPEFKTEALKRDEASVKFTQWKDGKPISKYRYDQL